MKKRKPKFIKDPKKRGEWVESVFMARAGEVGLPVSKPWGDSKSYDFVVGRPGQVRGGAGEVHDASSTGAGTSAASRGRGKKRIRAGSFDFLAAYVVLEDAWYIIPADGTSGAGDSAFVVCVRDSSRNENEKYREAWHLLREAADRCEGERERTKIWRRRKPA